MLRLTAILALAVLLPAAARGEDLDERIPAKPGGLLQVDLDFGDEIPSDQVSLQVLSHDADQVWVSAEKRGWGTSDVKLTLDSDERGVRLYGSVSGLFTMAFGGPSVWVRVWVPREFSLDLRSTTGSIRVEDIVGSLRIRARNGPIDVVGVEGPMTLRTTYGPIHVSESAGDLTVRAAEGEIEVSWITGKVLAVSGGGDLVARHVEGELEMRTDNGEIQLNHVRGDARAKTERGSVYVTFASAPSGELESRRGSIEVAFPRDSAVEIDARTGYGRVDLGPGIVLNGEKTDRRATGRLNGGGSRMLRIYTARGNVRLDQR